MTLDLDHYVQSASYRRDLAATRYVWAAPNVLETAGVFVFLTYLALPALVGVRSTAGRPARSALDGERERAFLLRFLGLSTEHSWAGGIGNPRVGRQAARLRERHARFDGMQPEYMSFIAAIIAVAPLKVRRVAGTSTSKTDRACYWRYVSHASVLLGASLSTERAAEDFCRAFAAVHSGICPDGRRLLQSLWLHHPKHVLRALPVLFDSSRLAVERLQAGAA